MAKDDIYKIIYVILQELYEARKAGMLVNLNDISPERFQINDGYYASILIDLIDEGYVRGVGYRKTKTGIVITNLKDIDITLRGIDYLKSNSAMKKVFEALKAVKNIAPGV